MKIALVLCVVAVALVQAKPEQYTDRYDNIDVKEILQNRRLLIPYLECMVKDKKVKCSPEAKELKSHIGEALSNDCAKCTKRQREVSREVIGHLINHEQDYWSKLVEKYDPTHKYTAKYESELTEARKA